MSKIEKQGVGTLLSALSSVDILDPYINYNDKYPSWDGIILIHSIKQADRKTRKAAIETPIPIQVKTFP